VRDDTKTGAKPSLKRGSKSELVNSDSILDRVIVIPEASEVYSIQSRDQRTVHTFVNPWYTMEPMRDNKKVEQIY